jgi:predicted nucleic acid-binding protein
LIVVDTSAWVELVRGRPSPVGQRLHAAISAREELAVTEVVVGEVLAGATSARDLRDLRRLLHSFPVLSLNGLAGYERAAQLARDCRRSGATLRRGLLDCLVAVPAIDADAPILHRDRDFDVLARHTELRVVGVDV